MKKSVRKQSSLSPHHFCILLCPLFFSWFCKQVSAHSITSASPPSSSAALHILSIQHFISYLSHPCTPSRSLSAPYLHFVSLSASHLVQSSRGKEGNITLHDHSAAVSAVSACFSVLFLHKKRNLKSFSISFN